ncbi:MAG: 50S ribosomal protein L10 [Candidatus Omnitrophica bacterium]|nr:50S ribosomal protein L10 [Candidatus Omnitrophota bacterium]
MPNVEKQVMLKELTKKVEHKPYVFFAQFSKLSAGDVSALRQNLQKEAAHCTVVKNTLLRRVLGDAVQDSAAFIEGQTLITTCVEEPQKVSKVLVTFAKEKEESFKLKGAFIEGRAFEKAYITELAKLPGKKELLTKVVTGVKSPITGFVLTLHAIVRSFVVVVNEIARKKGESQAAPAEAPQGE